MMAPCRSDGGGDMDEREKLIEILQAKPYGHSTYEEFADYLLANGVTVIPEGAVILTKEEIAALNEYQSKHGTDAVEVRHGKWYQHDKKKAGDDCYYCSVCEKMALSEDCMCWELTDYCPYCGAKMDGAGGEPVEKK